MNDTRLFFAKFLDHQKIIMTFDSLFPMLAGATMPPPMLQGFCRLVYSVGSPGIHRYEPLFAQPVRFTSFPTDKLLIFRSNQKQLTDDSSWHEIWNSDKDVQWKPSSGRRLRKHVNL